MKKVLGSLLAIAVLLVVVAFVVRNSSSAVSKIPISIIYPSEGAALVNSLGNESIATIQWSSLGLGDEPIKIEVVDTLGRVVETLAESTSNTGSYVWLYDKSIPSGRYKILLSNKTSKGSSGYFTLASVGV